PPSVHPQDSRSWVASMVKVRPWRSGLLVSSTWLVIAKLIVYSATPWWPRYGRSARRTTLGAVTGHRPAAARTPRTPSPRRRGSLPGSGVIVVIVSLSSVMLRFGRLRAFRALAVASARAAPMSGRAAMRADNIVAED